MPEIRIGRPIRMLIRPTTGETETAIIGNTIEMNVRATSTDILSVVLKLEGISASWTTEFVCDAGLFNFGCFFELRSSSIYNGELLVK
ncbi:hypothetical protein LQ318_10860 [Aliifodinibius salicampi]|uniref:Uncharacterized protein n=1 Tax=Fodinibius salicampi TaxID=1920655 RepID=A0ABT3PZV0_9BACT|nr:hypothetical protein [Fodinibius salicampi]MCW9713407.1 hypothetical protein [Fodinibius salicampi]